MKEIFKQKQKKTILDTLETFVIAFAVCAFIYITIAIPNKVEGQSMEPNFEHKDLVITNKTIQYLGETDFGRSQNYDYKRGDVVIVRQRNIDIIKRIVAIEGESIEIKNNSLYVEGQELNEKYLPITTRTKLPDKDESLLQNGTTLEVPDHSYFVMGDNRENSKDSRYRDVGFVDRDEIKGKVVFRYWPLTKFGIIHSGEYSLE